MLHAYDHPRFAVSVLVDQGHAKLLRHPGDDVPRQRLAADRHHAQRELVRGCGGIAAPPGLDLGGGGGEVGDTEFRQDAIALRDIVRPIAEQDGTADQERADETVEDPVFPALVGHVPEHVLVPDIKPETHVLLDCGQGADGSEQAVPGFDRLC
jgi:hypothetical protein